jgi:hypothetical protein
MLLGYGAHGDAQGGRYGSALCAASSKGHKAVVKILLDYGTDANSHNEGAVYGNALQAASSGGHEAIVKMLLDYHIFWERTTDRLWRRYG